MQISAALVKELRDRTGAGMMECKKALVETRGDVEAAVDVMRKAGQTEADRKAGRIAAEGLVAIVADAGARAAAMVEVNCETDFVAKEDAFRGFVQAAAERALAEGSGDLESLLAVPIETDGPSVEERRRELVARIGENLNVRRVVLVRAEGDRLGSYVHGGRIGVLVDVTGDAETAREMAMQIAASRPLCVSDEDVPAEVVSREKEILTAQAAESGKPPEIVERMVSGRMQKFLREVTLLGQPWVRNPDQTVAAFLESRGAVVHAFHRFEVGEGLEKKSENFAAEVMAQVRDR